MTQWTSANGPRSDMQIRLVHTHRRTIKTARTEQYGVNRHCERNTHLSRCMICATIRIYLLSQIRTVILRDPRRLNWLTLFLLELCWTAPYYRNATLFCRATGLKKRSNLCAALLPSPCREHTARQVPWTNRTSSARHLWYPLPEVAAYRLQRCLGTASHKSPYLGRDCKDSAWHLNPWTAGSELVVRWQAAAGAHESKLLTTAREERIVHELGMCKSKENSGFVRGFFAGRQSWFPMKINEKAIIWVDDWQILQNLNRSMSAMFFFVFYRHRHIFCCRFFVCCFFFEKTHTPS